jgi:transcriptional regulator with XRE-family HTH domain
MGLIRSPTHLRLGGARRAVECQRPEICDPLGGSVLRFRRLAKNGAHGGGTALSGAGTKNSPAALSGRWRALLKREGWEDQALAGLVFSRPKGYGPDNALAPPVVHLSHRLCRTVLADALARGAERPALGIRGEARWIQVHRPARRRPRAHLPPATPRVIKRRRSEMAKFPKAESTSRLSAAQCRAARALLDWSQSRLAEESGTAVGTIMDLERGKRTPYPRTLAHLRSAFEAAGVEFTNGGSPGVRLAFVVATCVECGLAAKVYSSGPKIEHTSWCRLGEQNALGCSNLLAAVSTARIK